MSACVDSASAVEIFAARHHFDPPHRTEPARLAESLRAIWSRYALDRTPPPLSDIPLLTRSGRLPATRFDLAPGSASGGRTLLRSSALERADRGGVRLS